MMGGEILLPGSPQAAFTSENSLSYTKQLDELQRRYCRSQQRVQHYR